MVCHELEQAMGRQGVGTYCLIHLKLDTFLGCNVRDLGQDCIGASLAPELFGIRTAHGHWIVKGCGGVELVSPVVNFYVGGHAIGTKLGNGAFKSSFSDVAPRAHHVGDHFYSHCCHDRGMQSADVTATFCATLVDEWIALGVRHAVVSPGSRSTPMALALLEATQRPTSSLRVEIFHDERSAAFAALGMATITRLPTIVLCTSGTAAANFHPAVVEASHNEIPLLVLTADRPPELQGVGAPQTIDQKNLYGSAARIFVDAGVPDDERAQDWRRSARRAFTISTGEHPGPVHINLPFREPLVGAVGALPARSDNASPRTTKALGTQVLAQLAARCSNKRGVIVAGNRGASPKQIEQLAATLGWPVLADPLGGARDENESAIRHADAWLRDAHLAAKFAPEVVLRFGTLPASKVVNAWLRDCQAEIIAVSNSPFLIDPDRRVTLHLVTDANSCCDDLGAVVSKCDGAWLQLWQTAEIRARTVVAAELDNELVLSEPGVARCVAASLPTGAHLVVSSSMPIRDLEWFAGATSHLTISANRGANGIDGVVSTAVGAAVASNSPTALLIGDVAFLHDTNGLLELVTRAVDLRVVVIDNRGGGIFSFLPQRTVLGEERFERAFGTPHSVDLTALCAAHKLPVTTVASTDQLRQAVAQPGPRVTIVQTKRTPNVAQHDHLTLSVIAAVRG